MIVFTNGCFDVLHHGHVDFLGRARSLGSRLVVGLNSDLSVRRIKGPERPFQAQEDRRAILLGLRSVDEVIIFDELTPERLIRDVRPDILVKGGDWGPDEIIGSDFVMQTGGTVHSLPLLEGHSSTSVIDRIRPKPAKSAASGDSVSASLNEHAEVFSEVMDSLVESIRACGELLQETVSAGKKVLVCGNGGSAADAQHIAAEFVGRYERERVALPAIALTTDTSALTAISNDYGFDRVFARQVEALASDGDCLIAISTSGNSPNVVAAMMEARRRGCRTIALTGAKGRKLASLADSAVLVPSDRTARVQEVHITIAHIWCEMVDDLFKLPGGPVH